MQVTGGSRGIREEYTAHRRLQRQWLFLKIHAGHITVLIIFNNFYVCYKIFFGIYLTFNKRSQKTCTSPIPFHLSLHMHNSEHIFFLVRKIK